MSLTFTYQPKLPHNVQWSAGYSVGSSCKEYYQTWFSKNGNGPKNGEKIILRNLPCRGNNYIRFWAAKPCNNKEKVWDDFNDAYDEPDSMMEKEPNVNYYNGGMVPICKNGKAMFRLHLPLGYMSKNGYIYPHFHYRLCQEGKMGPVHTEYIRNSCYSNNCNLLVMRNGSKSDRELKHHKNRLYDNKRDVMDDQVDLDPRDEHLDHPDEHDHDHHDDHHEDHHDRKDKKDKKRKKKKDKERKEYMDQDRPNYTEPPYKGSSNTTPDFNNTNMCDTFLSPQPCNNYKILPGPVSGSAFGPSYAIQYFNS